MSGVEVVSAVNAIVGIIDGLAQSWTVARKDIKFSDTFIKVSDQLPFLSCTLQICQQHLEPVEDTIPELEAQILYRAMQDCRIRAEKLQTIFRKIIPGEADQWYERYQAVARRLGQGSRVEELVGAITKDTQMLVNYPVMQSVRPYLGRTLEEALEEIQILPPSLPEEPRTGDHFSAGRDVNVNTGSGRMNMMSGSGITEYSGNGSPSLYFGERPAAYSEAKSSVVSSVVSSL